MGSTVEQQPVGKLVQQSFGEVPRVKLSKPIESKPKPICDRSGKPEDTERKRMYLLFRAEIRRNHNHKDIIMSVHPQELYPSGEESGLVEPGDYSPVAYSLCKQLSTLLRHGHLPQEDGAIEFLESKDYLRNKFVRSRHWSDGRIE